MMMGLSLVVAARWEEMHMFFLNLIDIEFNIQRKEKQSISPGLFQVCNCSVISFLRGTF